MRLCIGKPSVRAAAERRPILASRLVDLERSACWLSAARYAASAETSDGESYAPPIGGITPVCSFGLGTPWVIVRAMAARLPSPHSHLPFVRSDPSGANHDPVASSKPMMSVAPTARRDSERMIRIVSLFLLGVC